MELRRILTFLTLLTLTIADDTSVMNDLLSSISPAPSKWIRNTSFCGWTGVGCDSSNKYVTSINIDSLALSGTLPAGLNTLSQLKSLSLQQNKFSGPLPTLAGLASLQELRLDNNTFTLIPSDFFNGLTSLTSFSIGNNADLSAWEIPSDLTESTGLVSFYATNSNLMGSIPDFFGAFPSLMNLRLSYNNITGSLPLSFADSEIQNLWLNNQAIGLSGTIDVLGKMHQVTQVWLHKNAFTGAIPDLSNCTNLFDLQLRDNQFTGVLPASLTTLPKLVNITLQNNKLQGPVPEFGNGVHVELGSTNSFCKTTPGPCDPQVTTLLEIAGALGYPRTLAESWQNNDACKSWTFISCDTLGKTVTIVNFAKQKFSGTISPAFANLTALKSLYLNDNNLTGSIPDSLLTLTQLQVLDVSNNNLTGNIPVFPTTVKFNTSGNLLLGKDNSGGNANSPSASSPGSSNGKKTGIIIGVIIAAVILLVVVFISAWWKYRYKRHPRSERVEHLEKGKDVEKNSVIGLNKYGGVPSELQSQNGGDNNSDVHFLEGRNVFSIQILQKVTNNFSPDNILGRGGFGVVYKGEMPDGSKIAVKRMESAGMGSKGMKEFQAEIAVLTKVRHRHLVALLGYCINGDERLLVYEYMPQGTLSQHLFENGDKEHGYPPLTWKQRVTVALDVARGVEYLHSLARESFIHRDLKPSNILLGDDMRAKVADFGLVKHSPDGNYSMETRLAGTFGYLAPEYAATGRVTTKVDVYAFGVVLMEMITGRKALSETESDERSHLVSWFRRVLVNKDNLPKAIDQTLDQDEETFASICKAAELAGHCTAREAYQRPDMGHAVNVLGPLVEIWKPDSNEREDEEGGSDSNEREDEEGGSDSNEREDEEGGFGIDLDLSLPEALQRWQANEGTSSTFNDNYGTQTQSSIPANHSAFKDALSNGR